MKLATLKARLISYWEKEGKAHFQEVEKLSEADGVIFLCPRCFETNKGTVGTHSVICWFRDRVPDHVRPGPGRWEPSGEGLDDLTLSPSVDLSRGDGCQWHGFVRSGDAS